MGKRRKKPSKSKPVESLEHTASQQFADRQYKKALQTYKELLKKDDANSEKAAQWQQALVVCYRNRIHELMDKAMFKEALTLIENMSALTYVAMDTDEDLLIRHILCLLNMQKTAKAVHLYITNQPVLQKSQKARQLDTEIAARLLVGNQCCLDALPADWPIRQQCTDAKAVLALVCTGDRSPESLVAITEACKKIPFRSAFKDLILILKAIVILGEKEAASASDKAITLLAKIPQESAFYSLAGHLLSFASFQHHRNLSILSAKQVKLFAQWQCWSKEQSQSIQSALKAASGNDKAKFDCLLGLPTNTLAGPERQNACFLLLLGYPKGKSLYERDFGRLSVPEHLFIDALRAEQQRDWHSAYHFWIDFAEKIETQPFKGRILSPLEQSAVYKRIANYDIKYNFTEHDYGITAVEAWERCVRLDPDDIDLHIKLIKAYKKRKGKAYHQSVDRAVKCFPADRHILTMAIEAAMHKMAFKKAASLAKKLLKQDALNAFAKDALVNAHLAHARKQVQSKKFDKAGQEIDLALSFKPGGNLLSQTLMHSGWLNYLQLAKKNADKKESYDAFLRAAEAAEDDLTAAFLFIFEGLRHGIDKKRVFKHPAQPVNNASRSQNSGAGMLLLWVKQLNEYHQYLQPEHLMYAQVALDHLYKVVMTAGKGLSNKKDFEDVCACLYTYKASKLLASLANAALREHSDAIIFNFYVIYADVGGNPAKVSREQENQLEAYMDQAEGMNNTPLEAMFRDFLIAVERAKSPFYFGDSDDDFMDFDNRSDASSSFDQLQDAVARILDDMSPDQVKNLMASMMDDDAQEQTDDARAEEMNEMYMEDLFGQRPKKKKVKKKNLPF